jgi:hypothetical protein
MDLGSRISRARCALVWGAVSALGALAAAGLTPVVTSGPAGQPGPGFEGTLVWCCAMTAAIAVGWLWVGASVSVLDAARGRHRPRRGVPDGVRRVIALLCGAALVSGLAAPALAADPGARGAGAGRLAGLRLPERVSVSHHARTATGDLQVRTAAAASSGESRSVVVQPGDTLWSLSAAHLGPDASDAEVAVYWPRLYATNRDRVGADPDLIEAGQQLTLPDNQSVADDAH